MYAKNAKGGSTVAHKWPTAKQKLQMKELLSMSERVLSYV